jgi:transcriptional regulator of acetoin/glycerol metabolism
LREHPWPGNVRELRLTIQRAGCLVGNGSLPASAVAEAIELGVPRPSFSSKGRELLECLSASNWNVDAAAAQYGIRRSAFYERLRREGVSTKEVRVRVSRESKGNTSMASSMASSH